MVVDMSINVLEDEKVGAFNALLRQQTKGAAAASWPTTATMRETTRTYSSGSRIFGEDEVRAA